MENKKIKENVNLVQFIHLLADKTDEILTDELKRQGLEIDALLDYLYEIEEAYLEEEYDLASKILIDMVRDFTNGFEMVLEYFFKIDEMYSKYFLDYYLNHIANYYQVDAMFSSCDDCDFRSEDSLYDSDKYLGEEETNSEATESEVSVSLNLDKLLEAVEDLINSAVKEVIKYEKNKSDCNL